jgi:hypothetical protein
VTDAAVFVYGDLGILVESTAPSHLTWLGEFLDPHFETRVAAAPHACRVLLVEDRGRYDEALAAGPGDGALDAFALDSRVVSLPRWRGAEMRLFDVDWEVFYEIAGPPLAVTILSVPGNWKARTALMRVVRELATNHAQRAGGLLLHAAAFAVGRRGVIVGGPKQAGKTSLLVHALRAASIEYVSNDRVLVLPGTTPRGRGVPAIVALRRDTLDLFPALAERLAATAYYQRLTLEEAAGDPVPSAGQRAGLPRLSPIQLCRLLGVRARAECEIAAMVFPRITGQPGASSLRRLSPAETCVQLDGSLFGIRPGRWSSAVFALAEGPPPADRAALTARCEALADSVPGFECRLGLGAYESARAADDLVATLLA